MAHLQQGAYEEADKAFLQALREDPEKGNADTLVNLLTTAQHLHKPPETVQKLLTYVMGTGVGVWGERDCTHACIHVDLPTTHSKLYITNHTTRHYSQLQKCAPSHPYVASLATLDAAFDRLQQQYASHVTSA